MLEVAISSRGEWRRGMTIEFYSDGFLSAGAEYLAFLTHREFLKGYDFGGGALAITMIEGRVEWSREGEFGFRDDAPLSRALAGIRATYARYTRYRPLGKEGERCVDLYTEPLGPMERPFDLVREPQSSRQLPRTGDRVRLSQGGTISIVNFGSQGEALRERPSTLDNYDASRANVTGTRVDAGRVYDVADIVLESANGTLRYVWVRLVSVQDGR